MILVSLAAPLVAVVFLATRLAPSLLAGVSGVDVWYHLIYAREMRRQRRIAPRLQAYFTLEPSTRYPPLFAALLSILPERFLKHWSVWIGVCIDVLHLLVLWTVAAAMFGVSRALVAVAIYSVHPTLGLEYSTLNPRSLASFFVTGFFLSVLANYMGMGSAYFGLAAFFFTLVLLTNKFAAQLVVVAVGFLALERPSMAFLPLLAAGMALALSGGHYRDVFRGHVEILNFWRKRIGAIGAHQVLESPLYFEPAHASTRFYMGGLRGAVRLGRRLLAHDPFLPFVVLLLLGDPRVPGRLWVLWPLTVYACALLATFVGPLRFVGEGYRYLKFAVFPEACLLAYYGEWWTVTLPILASLYIQARLLKSRRLETVAPGFVDLVQYLARDTGPLAVLPAHLSNRIAFETGRPVIWGGHSSGFDQLDSWIPVLRNRLEVLLASNGSSELVLDNRFVTPEVFGSAFHTQRTFGSYSILRLDGVSAKKE